MPRLCPTTDQVVIRVLPQYAASAAQSPGAAPRQGTATAACPACIEPVMPSCRLYLDFETRTWQKALQWIC